MKKLTLLLIFIYISHNSFSQKNEDFKPGVQLLENNIISQYETPSSILFIFKGDTHLINFYLDLRKKIKKQFRKSKLKIDFDYELNIDKPLKSDLESIPKNKFQKTDYDLTCSISISISDIKTWNLDKQITHKNKQSYALNLVLEENTTNQTVEYATINVNSINTIITQNTNSSKLIFDLITN